MSKKQFNVDDFTRRLDEAGVKYEMTELDNGYHQIEVVFKGRESDQQWKRDTLAVQGLIYHFLNREWILDDSYVYVMQNRHKVLFNKERGDK
jgi:predicted N-acyltransferase